MSSFAKSNTLTFIAGGTITKGQAIKPGADRRTVLASVLATSKNFGVAMNDAGIGDNVEVALPGGGAKGKINGAVFFGDMLVPDNTGNLITTTTTGDRYVAVAMEDAVQGDLSSIHIVVGVL